ncbi:MAG TPA: hypothetical protein DHV30_08075, partial [Balneola sp.]|nr:hypothetical protein [Balneola sp.]
MKKKLSITLLGIIILYGLLLIPDNSTINIEIEGNSTPFIWDQDERWDFLESKFTEAKADKEIITPGVIEALISDLFSIVDEIENREPKPDDVIFDELLLSFFELAPVIGAQDVQNPEFFEVYNRARRVIKDLSAEWDVSEKETRDILYKTLYGMRATVEEVLLQSEEPIDPVLYVKEEESQTPATNILGIKVHSGDLLVSRGGAEVSALISRGNDYPGNFSHVALIYVEEGTNIPYLIEAHIERGVAIATLEEYIKDRKLRFMVLRPRADLSEMQKNPMLPHIAAKEMFEEVQQRHIPYDFKMNFYDPEAMFCSEVGSYAYKNNGIQ